MIHVNILKRFVFLGVAKSNLTRISESEQAYLRAIDIEYSNPLAWQVRYVRL